MKLHSWFCWVQCTLPIRLLWWYAMCVATNSETEPLQTTHDVYPHGSRRGKAILRRNLLRRKHRLFPKEKITPATKQKFVVGKLFDNLFAFVHKCPVFDASLSRRYVAQVQQANTSHCIKDVSSAAWSAAEFVDWAHWPPQHRPPLISVTIPLYLDRVGPIFLREYKFI